MHARREWYWLLLILLLGLFLRVYQLDTESFWTDEAFSVHHAGLESPREVVDAVRRTEAAPSGYYLLLHYWVQFLGTTEFIVRLLSALLSTAALAVLYLVIRFFASSRVALLGVFFMATSMLQIEYAQEARIYGLFTLVSLCMVFFFARWFLTPEQNNRWIWGYACCTLLGLWINYMTVFLILGLTLVFLFTPGRWRAKWKKWIGTNILVAGAFLLPGSYTIGVMLPQFQSLNTGLAGTLVSKGVPSFLAQLGLFFFVLPALTFALLGGLFLARAEIRTALQKADRYFFLALIGIGTFYLYLSLKPLIISTIPVIRVPITNSYFLIRHSFFLVPLWYVYLAYKVDHYLFDPERPRKVLGVFCFLLILLFSSSALYLYYTQPTKVQWREATEFIAVQDTTGKPLILLDKGGFSNEFLLRYYYDRSFSLFKLTWSEEGREFHQLDDEAVLRTLNALNREEFWLVLSRNPRTGEHYRDLLDRHYRRDFDQQFYGIEVFHYTIGST